MLALSLLRRLGLDELTLHLNSIGCGKCRREYNKALFDYLKSHIDGMCKTCQDRLERNPMRILDCKEERCKEICRSAPRTLDYLCDDCRAHFDGLKRCLDTCGVKYVVDPDIVRGLDYYTGTVFEIVSTRIGSQGTVCGGGRYNNLVEELGGQSLPAVGFGMGMERLLMVMENANAVIPKPKPVKVYFAAMGEQPRLAAFGLVQKLRENGVLPSSTTWSAALRRNSNTQTRFLRNMLQFSAMTSLRQEQQKSNAWRTVLKPPSSLMSLLTILRTETRSAIKYEQSKREL